MTIGQLYNPLNVVVGQAACFVAPQFTPLPDISLTALATGTPDPFDPSPWVAARVGASATVTAGTFVLAYTLNGVTYTTGAATATSTTAAQLDTLITAALAPLGAQTSDVTVSGGPVSAVATPFLISLSEPFAGGTWTLTPTGITGGTLSLTAPLWVPVGATDQGWKLDANKSTTNIMIEEQTSPVATTMTSQIISIQGTLSEDISRTLQTVYNMTNGYTAASSGHAGFETLNMTDNIITYAVALVMQNNLGLSRWCYIPQTTCLGNASADFRRAAAKRMYAATFSSTCQTSQIVIENVLQRGL